MAMSGVFKAEFGDNRSRNFIVRSLDNLRIRGRFALSERGESDSPGYYVGEKMSQLPAMPGMEIEVRWSSGKVTISDPLDKDEARVAKLNKILSGVDAVGKSERKPTPVKVFELDQDRLFTLAEELRRMMDTSLIVKDGTIPKADEFKKANARELHDPGATKSPSTPRFADEMDAFRKRLIESPQ